MHRAFQCQKSSKLPFSSAIFPSRTSASFASLTRNLHLGVPGVCGYDASGMLLPDETYEESAAAACHLLAMLRVYDDFLARYRIRPEFFCRWVAEQLRNCFTVISGIHENLIVRWKFGWRKSGTRVLGGMRGFAPFEKAHGAGFAGVNGLDGIDVFSTVPSP